MRPECLNAEQADALELYCKRRKDMHFDKMTRKLTIRFDMQVFKQCSAKFQNSDQNINVNDILRHIILPNAQQGRSFYQWLVYNESHCPRFEDNSVVIIDYKNDKDVFKLSDTFDYGVILPVIINFPFGSTTIHVMTYFRFFRDRKPICNCCGNVKKCYFPVYRKQLTRG